MAGLSNAPKSRQAQFLAKREFCVSLGGMALSRTTTMPDLVSVVVVHYSSTSLFSDPRDLVSRLKEPMGSCARLSYALSLYSEGLHERSRRIRKASSIPS
jgi:hypothetical protein